MGKQSDKNTRTLEESKEYPRNKLEGIFEDDSFSKKLNELIEAYCHPKDGTPGRLMEDLYRHSNLQHTRLAEIRTYNPSNDAKKSKRPKRDNLLSLCIELRATKEDINLLLRSVGYNPLDSRVAADTIIIWGLSQNKDPDAIREELSKEGFTQFEPGSAD